MGKLLGPLPDPLPTFSELPAFIKTRLNKKLVCMDCDYNVALHTDSALTDQLLIPLSKVTLPLMHSPHMQAPSLQSGCVHV